MLIIFNRDMIEGNLSRAIIAHWAVKNSIPEPDIMELTNEEPFSVKDLSIVDKRDIILVKPRMTDAVLKQLLSKCRSAVVFTNTVSTLNAVDNFLTESKATTVARYGGRYHFIPDLVWTTLLPNEPRPLINAYVQDAYADVQQYEDSPAIRTALTSLSVDKRDYSDLLSATEDDLAIWVRRGNLLRDSRLNIIQRSIAGAKRRLFITERLELYAVGTLQAYVAETAELLASKHGIGAAYYDTEHFRSYTIVNAQTNTKTANLSALVKEYGGKGDDRCATFRVMRHHLLAQA